MATSLAPWFQGQAGTDISADLLRLLVQAGAADTATLRSLLGCVRLGLDRLLRSGTEPAVRPCLHGALHLAVDATGTSTEGIRTFAGQVLSLPYLIARLLKEPQTTQLIAELFSVRFEAIVESLQTLDPAQLPPAGAVMLRGTPRYPGAAWLLGNLIGLSVASGKTSGAYIRILGQLVSSLPKGCLTAADALKKPSAAVVSVPDSEDSEEEDKPASPEHSKAKLPSALQEEIVALAGEAHLRATLITSLQACPSPSPSP